MQINEARIYSYGKLQRRDITFSSGINIIYGENEAGKTTLHAFLLAMLFGMEKKRGRMAAGEVYARYEPWHAPAYYSGALRFSVDESSFYLERNFYHREKRELLRNEVDGEELSVAYGDLTMLLGGVGKEAFGNTYDIPQSGATAGRELTDILTEYLSDASESGDGGTHVTKAVMSLEAKKRERNADLRKKQEIRQKEMQQLLLEQELLEQDRVTLEREIERMRGEQGELKRKLEAARREQQFLREKEKQKEQPPLWKEELEKAMNLYENRMRKASFLIMAACIGLLFHWVTAKVTSYSDVLFWVVQTLLGVFLGGAVFVFFKSSVNLREEKRQALRILQRQKREEAKGSLWQERAFTERNPEEELWRQVNQMRKRQEELLLEKETRIYNISELIKERECPDAEEIEMAEDISALELAVTQIKRLAKEFCEEVADELNVEVSRTVAAVTAGRYDSVRIDGDGKLKIRTEGREVSPEALSRGTLEQLYLALRIAVGRKITLAEPMPIFLDEAFAMYDDKRLMETLRYLASMGGQVLIFTCQSREMEQLGRLGITYHRIDL